MILMLAEAQAWAERALGRLMSDEEVDRFRSHIRAFYVARGRL